VGTGTTSSGNHRGTSYHRKYNAGNLSLTGTAHIFQDLSCITVSLAYTHLFIFRCQEIGVTLFIVHGFSLSFRIKVVT
jgi:hypothetical protein